MKKQVTITVLGILNNSREGMTVRQIFEKLNDEHFEYAALDALHSIVSMMKKKGLVKLDGRHECPLCYHPNANYRIAEDGRAKLQKHREGKVS